MSFFLPLDSRVALAFSFSSADDAFKRAAVSLRPRRLHRELSVTGFVACALTAALLASTPGTARADAKKVAPTIAAKPRATAPRTAPQTCVAESANVASAVARPRVSTLKALKPIAASSRRSANAQNSGAVEDTRDKKFAPTEINSTDDANVVEALPAAPVTQSATRLAAGPQEKTEEKKEQMALVRIAQVAPVAVEIVPAETTPTETTETKTIQDGNNAPQNTGEISEPLTATFDMNAPAPQAGSTPSTPSAPATPPANADSTTAPANAQTSAAGAPSRLYAPRISYEGGTIVAQGTPENPVRLESAGARIIAQSVRLDTVGKTVSAQGKVRVERQVTVKRYSAYGTNSRENEGQNETITETLQGEKFEYNYETRQGQLGATKVRLANLNITAQSLIINGQKYVARNVIVRPGGLSDEELKIYGTPPLNLRLREFTVDLSKPAATGAQVSDTGKDDSASVNFSGRTYGKGGALYFKNTRILPVPSAFLNRNLGRREEATYQITPRISTNSVDGILLTTKLYFPITSKNPERLSVATDIGLSAKIGFRGGVQLESANRLGDFTLGARINDIVETQLNNRIELDRLPELRYRPPSLGLFELPGGRRAGLKFGFIAGDYRERFTDGSRETRSSRLQAQVRFTTRLARRDGPYLDLFARASQYSKHPENLRTAGFEIGYSGPLTNRLAGQFSYSATSVSGSTPFRFDEIEIRKELRATFDILLSPRYIVPIDLRYDVDRRELRDTTFGILRNYKTFAYGVTYQSSRREVKLEIRQGF